jgi:hypothetical protein
VRKALGTLPWVEHDSIQTDVDNREVRFNLKDRTALNLDEARKALKAQGFSEVSLKSAP